MSDRRVPVRVPGSVDAEVDGQRVLLSPKDFSYFGVAGSGAAVWDLIDGSRSIDDLVAELQSRFEADPGAIRIETIDFLLALEAAGLVAPLDGAGT